MKMKTLVLGLVSGLLLAACGGPVGEDEGTEQLGTSESALCEGWDSGARRCSFKCVSDSTWWTSPAGAAPQNGCGELATKQCGRAPYSTCWSK